MEKDAPGYRIGKHEDKMGIRCVPVVEVHFENCRVPAANLLGEEGSGFLCLMQTFLGERIYLAAMGYYPQLDLALAAQWNTDSVRTRPKSWGTSAASTSPCS